MIIKIFRFIFNNFKNLLLCVLIFFIIITTYYKPDLIKENFVIAAVSMGGEHKLIGKGMLSGIHLYLDQLNRNGGINGRKVRLDVYDDKGDRDTAIKIAMEITKRNKALVVLGHYFSDCSLAASKVYLKARIPAITGSATAEKITQKNDWYFAVAPNNSFQGSFLANYICSSLGHKTCSIIYDSDDYGTSLFRSFEEKAHSIGIDIKNVWSFDKNDPQFSTQIGQLISQLRSTPHPGIIFIATHANEGARIISSLRYPGADCQVIGPDSFSTHAFIKNLSNYPQEKIRPGYYSDGIYTVTPFLADFNNEYSQKFISSYVKRFHRKPSWVSACYYDATHIAIKAMQELEGEEKIRHNRMLIKNSLASKYNIETSEKGVCGPIFFDKDRNVKHPLRVCVYKNQQLAPDYFQYNLLTHPMSEDNTFEKILNKQLITSGDIIMNKTRIVFSGIHVNEISNFDMQKGVYTMDFFMWFRFQGEFDEKDISFLNAVTPIQLPICIAEYKNNDKVTRVYHLKEQFYSLLDFQRFPFETHDLSIKLRHRKQTADKLMLIPDNDEPHLNQLLKIEGQKTAVKMQGWGVSDSYKYNGIVSYESSLGIPVQYHLKRPIVYSTYSVTVRIKRNNLSFAIKLLSPAIVLFILFFTVSLLHYRYHFHYFFSLLMVLFISGLFLFRSILMINVSYMLLLQYVYLSLFISSSAGIVMYILILLLRVPDRYKQRLSRYLRALTIVCVFAILYYAYISYKPLNFNKFVHVYKNHEPLKESIH
jgi:branched-chain amino acid transport system substrate-binding protein